MTDEQIVAEAMENHDKHYWGLVQWLKRKKKNEFDLADMISEGSTVAHAIWKKYEKDWPPTLRNNGTVPQQPLTGSQGSPKLPSFKKYLRGFCKKYKCVVNVLDEQPQMHYKYIKELLGNFS